MQAMDGRLVARPRLLLLIVAGVLTASALAVFFASPSAAGHATLTDLSLPVIDADFSRSGDYRDFWTESLTSFDEEISLTWYSPGDPLLIHTDPKADPARPYGVCTVLVPVSGARLVINGIAAAGTPWPREREGRPFSTSALAFSESWTEAR